MENDSVLSVWFDGRLANREGERKSERKMTDSYSSSNGFILIQIETQT